METEAKANATEAELERCKRRLEAETAQRRECEAKCFALQERLETMSPKTTITAFLRAHIRPDEDGFVQSKRILEAFINHTKAQLHDQLFFKQLKLQLPTLFPTATYGRRDRGYHGIKLLVAPTGRPTRV